MNSHWVTAKPNYPPPSNCKELMDKINKQIDEQIEYYELNFDGNEDVYIKSLLKLIKDLAQNIKDSDDIRSIEKIISTFCEIMGIQRETIHELSVVYTQPINQNTSQNNYVSSYAAPTEGFTNDAQIKAEFTAYMEREGRSNFTANDYILRVQNLWRSFYADYEAGELPNELAESIIQEEIRPETPLLNAYNYIEELNCYVSINIASAGENRNWTNIRAALNTFAKALYKDKYEKVKPERTKTQNKDFSKYLFEGNAYPKSRLALAVVTKYAEDFKPSTFDELKDAFPDALQGSLGVVRRIDDVSDKYKGIGGVKRYFVKENEIIRLSSGEEVIVCTQWGANIEQFVEHAMFVWGYEIAKI